MKIELQGLKELKEYADVLELYTKLNKRNRQKLSRKKGLDLTIQLYRGFKKRKWKGGKQVGLREVRKRAKQGRGTKVRKKQLSSRHAGSAPVKSKKGRKLNRRQQLVWQEATRRTSGRGVLAIGFLTKRYRQGVLGTGPMARYTKANRSREIGKLAEIKVAPDYFRITGLTPGLVEVSNRYGILSQAVAAGRKDTINYIQKKTGEDFEEVMRSHGFKH